jgi:hypothetical protein
MFGLISEIFRNYSIFRARQHRASMSVNMGLELGIGNLMLDA